MITQFQNVNISVCRQHYPPPPTSCLVLTPPQALERWPLLLISQVFSQRSFIHENEYMLSSIFHKSQHVLYIVHTEFLIHFYSCNIFHCRNVPNLYITMITLSCLQACNLNHCVIVSIDQILTQQVVGTPFFGYMLLNCLPQRLQDLPSASKVQKGPFFLGTLCQISMKVKHICSHLPLSL